MPIRTVGIIMLFNKWSQCNELPKVGNEILVSAFEFWNVTGFKEQRVNMKFVVLIQSTIIHAL